MAIYVYKCKKCGNTKELNRKVAERNNWVRCPYCQSGFPRIMTRQVTAPGGFKGLEVNH